MNFFKIYIHIIQHLFKLNCVVHARSTNEYVNMNVDCVPEKTVKNSNSSTLKKRERGLV